MAKVYLVGAGPGAEDLLTLRAAARLQRADTVLYDRLVHPDVLRHVPPRAERVYVGKSKGEDMTARQERIYALMIGHARAGKTVVRLKGGDPFVFGRGGEELNRLAAAGIEAEVVPGISSCIAAPAAANIPVTYRGTAASFGVFAGRPGEGNRDAGVDWTAAARIQTAVFLMGVERLPLIVSSLLAHGRAPSTPAALVANGTRDEQVVVRGTLADIERRAAGVPAPATIVVGEVVDAVSAVADAAVACAAPA